MTTSTKRSLKVAELIFRNLAPLLRQYMREPLLSTVILTYVRVSNDLSHATIFFTLLDKTNLKRVTELFDKETKRIRSMVAKKIKLRYMPELKFIYDDFTEKKEKLLDLINHIPSDEV